MKITNRISCKLIFLLFIVAISVSSCRKELPSVNDPANYITLNYDQVFEGFWNGMNNNYVFWDIDTTNWDNMYLRYKPLFSKLNIRDSNDQKKSIQYFKEMTSGLIDSHYTLYFDLNISRETINPSYERKRKNPNFHGLVSGYYQFDRGYLDRGSVAATNKGVSAVAGTFQGNILYFGFSDFDLKSEYQSNDSLRPVIQFVFDFLKNPPTDFKGIILDVRSNGGGNGDDLDFLVGKLINKPLHFGYTRYKNGNGRLDYTPWAEAIVKPQLGYGGVTKPIIVLTDQHSASMAEITAMAIHTLSNGRIVGETTWGANGPLTSNIFQNGGQFSNGGFLYAYTSSSTFKYIDGQIYEGKGFPPDVSVPFNPAAFRSNHDPAFERAITLLR